MKSYGQVVKQFNTILFVQFNRESTLCDNWLMQQTVRKRLWKKTGLPESGITGKLEAAMAGNPLSSLFIAL
jgi:hypothetical protein